MPELRKDICASAGCSLQPDEMSCVRNSDDEVINDTYSCQWQGGDGKDNILG